MSNFPGAAKALLRTAAKKIVYNTVQPAPWNRWFFSGLFNAEWYGRELYEWGRRSLVATPVFLSRCHSFGEDISVDRVPYITGDCRIELGSHIRISGEIGIKPSSHVKALPVLKIGNGVFIGHNTRFALAERIELGDFVSVGGGTYISDTEGHDHYNPGRPIWEVPATSADIAPVIIEDNVQISINCMILKGVRIGARSVIGAGAVIRSDVPADSIVMGNPGRALQRKT
jgi:acetyltransferase-like isoleucine patch superfamily enzyme